MSIFNSLSLQQLMPQPLPQHEGQSLSFSFSEYSAKVLELFQTFSWAFDYKGTEVLLPKNWTRIPQEFIEFCQEHGSEKADVFQEILHCTSTSIRDSSRFPSIINHFIQLCTQVKVCPSQSESPESYEPCQSHTNASTNRKNWTPKKSSEVRYLSEFIGNVVQENPDVDLIVDIGSGLGYLSTHLAETYGLCIMAVESQADRHTSAKSIAKNPIPSKSTSAGSGSVLHINLKLSSSIASELDPLVQNFKSILITGLHACGDLTPWAMNWFLGNPRCKLLAIVPCCYHRMEMAMANVNPNFPMSNTLKEVIGLASFPSQIPVSVPIFLSNQFFRLASQRSGATFLDDIGPETRHAFYRGILELYLAQNGNLSSVRAKRKVIKGDPLDFDNYVERTIGEFGGYRLSDSSGTGDFDHEFEYHRAELIKLHNENLQFYPVVTGLLSFQGALQPIAENLIVRDRLEYLLQHTEIVEDGWAKRIFPSNVSPRGSVLYAKKNQKLV